MLIAVILASVFFSMRTAVVVAVAIFATLCVLPIWVIELRAPDRLVPLLALHGVLSPLLLVAANHQAAVERESRNELARMDARLMQIESLDRLARRAGSTAHDLNNLLTVIGANVSSLDAEPRLRLSQELSEIRLAVSRAGSLSRQLLVSAREGSLRPELLDVGGAIHDFEPLLRRAAPPPVRIALRASPDLPRVKINTLHLEQVLINLVINARDAMPEGGALTIECTEVLVESADDPEHHEVRPGRYVRIAVMDGGVGMDPTTLARVFEPFFTTKGKTGGTGLGLAIVHEIVVLAHGYVKAKSTPGAGTTFCIYLPGTELG
jgi:signal transduction histidine kinase